MRLFFLALSCCLAACCLYGIVNGASTQADDRRPDWSLVLRQGMTWGVQIDSNDNVLLLGNSATSERRTNGIPREPTESISIPVLSEFVEVTITSPNRYDGLQLLLDGKRLSFPKWERSTSATFGTEPHRLQLPPLVGQVHTLKVKHGSEKHQGERDYFIEVVPSVRKASPLFYRVTPTAFALTIGTSRPTDILVFTNCGGQSFLAERYLKWLDLAPFINVVTNYGIMTNHWPCARKATDWVTNARIYAVQAYLRWLKETTLAPGVFRFQNSVEANTNVPPDFSPDRFEAIADPVPLWHKHDAVRLLGYTNNVVMKSVAAPVNFPSVETKTNVYFRICYDVGQLSASGAE